jgi:hypothetical protein
MKEHRFFNKFQSSPAPSLTEERGSLRIFSNQSGDKIFKIE